MEYISELYEAGKIKSVIDGPYAFDKVPWAIRYFGEGKHHGKVVISVA
jgi:NADPH:quinone reductase-like Zn-dependent oxidoreductase